MYYVVVSRHAAAIDGEEEIDEEEDADDAGILGVQGRGLVWRADELLASFEGREYELLENLKQMKAKKEEDAEIIAQIKLLVEELACPKSADEMLTTYKGQEKVLLTNLKKMKDARVEA